MATRRCPPSPLSLTSLSVDLPSPPSASDQCEPVMILPFLFLGSEIHASNRSVLEKLGITALLNVSHTCPNHFEETFEYKCIPVEDSGTQDISVYFKEAIEYIEQVRLSGGKILVHCMAGVSRSSTICIAYIMATQKIRMEQAYEFVKSRRRCVSPNFHFMEQLLTFESCVFNPSTISTATTTVAGTSIASTIPIATATLTTSTTSTSRTSNNQQS